jgi:hypothetical protein
MHRAQRIREIQKKKKGGTDDNVIERIPRTRWICTAGLLKRPTLLHRGEGFFYVVHLLGSRIDYLDRWRWTRRIRKEQTDQRTFSRSFTRRQELRRSRIEPGPGARRAAGSSTSLRSLLTARVRATHKLVTIIISISGCGSPNYHTSILSVTSRSRCWRRVKRCSEWTTTLGFLCATNLQWRH